MIIKTVIIIFWFNPQIKKYIYYEGKQGFNATYMESNISGKNQDLLIKSKEAENPKSV